MIIIIKVRQIRVNKLTQSLLRWFTVHTFADQHSEPIRIISHYSILGKNHIIKDLYFYVILFNGQRFVAAANSV